MSIFGVPQSILSDNGGEFDNNLLDIAELLSTKILTTAAYSPWSNGIVERHNAVTENMILKISKDTNCSVESALVWAISAKNALHNNLGYSPNQLVFGRNPNLPSVLNAKPPALHTSTTSQLIADHLNALHVARQAFIQSEASKKLKTALQRQTRTATSKMFAIGDHVYYKRNDSKAWHGPGVILGVDSNLALVRHGGSHLHVNPCHLCKVKDDSQIVGIPVKQSDIMNDCDRYESGQSKQLDSSSDIVVTIDADEPINADEIPNDRHSTEAESVEMNNLDTGIDPLHSNPYQSAKLEDIEHDETPTLNQEEGHSKQNNQEIPSQSQQDSDHTNSNIESLSNQSGQSEEYVDIPPVLPRIRDRIWFVDPDTNGLGGYMVISRAGKATGINQYWLNVKNLQNGIMKSVDFEQITEWTKIQEEVLFSADNSPEVLKAQQDGLDKWREYKVYDKVEDLGQEAISTRWVLTEKVIDNSAVVKARLVAHGFEETATNIWTDSPTVCKENIRLVATISAANNWKIHTLDVKAAFLQGFPID